MKVSTIGFQELGIVLNSVDCRGGGGRGGTIKSLIVWGVYINFVLFWVETQWLVYVQPKSKRTGQ